MPTYEYHCEKCGHAFEKFQPITEAPLTVCPKDACPRSRWGKGKVKRAVGGGAGLLFKGSGFYITDYRSEGYKKAASKESASSSSSDSKPASPAKPASPPGGKSTKPPTGS